MLGKLLKHEFRATGRIMLPLLGVELLLSVFAGLSVRGLDRVQNLDFLRALYIMTLVIFFLGLFAVSVVAFVLMIQRFYRSLLRDEGYLSMTLPVSVDEHIWAKLIVSFVWFAAVGLLCALSMLVVVSLGGVVSLNAAIGFEDILGEIRLGVKEIGIGHITLYLLEFLLFGIFMAFAGCLRCYSAMAIGCSAADHKLILSFVAYIVIGIAQSMLWNALSVILYNSDALDKLFDGVEILHFHGFLWIMILFGAVYAAIFYFITRWFLRNRLNLA